MKLIILGFIKENLGDDLMIKTIIENTDYDEYIIIGAKQLGIETKKDSQIRYIGKSLLRIFLLINKEDNVAIIGGSVFRDNLIHYINPGVHLNKLVILISSQIKGASSYIIGSNISKVNCQWRYSLLLQAFGKLVNAWTVRDRYSKEFLEQLGVNNVVLAEDIVFACDIDEFKCSEESNTVGISIISSKKGYNYQEYIENIKSWIDFFLQQNFTIKLLLFQNSEDYETAKKIKDLYQSNLITIIPYLQGDVIKEIFKSEYIIASRFHSLVLALLMNKKVLTYSYDNKIENFMTDHHWDSKIIELDTNLKPDLNRFCKLNPQLKLLMNSSLRHSEILKSTHK